MPERNKRPSIDKKPVNVGIIGRGNVGKGVVEWFQDGKGEHFNVHLTRVAVAAPSKHKESGLGNKLTGDVKDIFEDPKINLVVELMGGVDLARQYALEAIGRGMSFVTANKALMSRFAGELFERAREEYVDVAFEAAVAGGVPIIGTVNRYRGEKINKIIGVLNGTTNFILTRMEEGLDFDTALKIAQDRGFAEADHILDTGGFDTRDKLSILAMLMFNTQVDPETIECRGITDITPADFEFASSYGVAEGGPGYAIKLLGIADRKNGAIELRVNPALVRKDHPLANVRDEVNAVFLEGELAGPQMFVGRGAGTDATTSAVVSDILHVASNIQREVVDELPSLDEKVVFVASGDAEKTGYIRVDLEDKPGSLYNVTGIIARDGLSVANSLQRESHAYEFGGKKYNPDIITLKPAAGRVIESALKALSKSNRVNGNPFFMSIEE